MVNPIMQKEVLQILCKNASRDGSLASAFVEIEKRLFYAGVQTDKVLRFNDPYNSGFSLDISIERGELEIKAKSKNNFISMKHHRSYAALYELGQKLSKMIDDEHITLAPLPDEDFTKAILSAQKGSVINFNNQLAVVCVDSNEERKVFKKQFSGNLFDITMDSFIQSDTYIINVNNQKDLHFLYGKAFSSLTNTADVRITDEYMGQFLCTDIETKIPVSSRKTIEIGPLKITAIKDHNRNVAWYDGAGNELDRELVSSIFGWAKNTIPETRIQDWKNYNPAEGLEPFPADKYNEFLCSIKEYANERKFDLLVEHAFCFAKNGEIMTLSIEDLEQDKNGNFIPVTYAFKTDELGQHIYKFTYPDANIYEWPKTATEITKEEFLRFCQQKYDDTYQSIINKNEKTIARLTAAGLSKNEAINQIINKIKQRTDYNFLGVTKEDVNTLTIKVSLLLENLTQNNQLSAEEFIDYDDIE